MTRPQHARTAQAILVAGLLAGVLDIAAAFIVYGLRGATPPRILQAMASGMFGASAFRGGAATAALGAALHFLIALSAAAVYYAASRWLPILVRRPVPSGLLYGIAVYVFMNHLVVPLSAVAQPLLPGARRRHFGGSHDVCRPTHLSDDRAPCRTAAGSSRRVAEMMCSAGAPRPPVQVATRAFGARSGWFFRRTAQVLSCGA